MSVTHSSSIREVSVGQLKPNPFQPRSKPGNIDSLADSIREHGIQQPLLAQACEDGTFTLVAGERRLRAAQAAGLATVPVVVTEGDPAILALVENLERENLNPLEQAIAFSRLLEHGETQNSLARKLSISPHLIASTIRLLGLGHEGRKALESGLISVSAARQLLRLDVFDRLATRTPAENGLNCWDSWLDQGSKYVLWTPCCYRRAADVQHGVDELFSDLHGLVNEYGDLPGSEAEAKAREACPKGKILRVHEQGYTEQRIARRFLQLRPDFSRLTDSDRKAIEEAYWRWFDRYCAEHDLVAT